MFARLFSWLRQSAHVFRSIYVSVLVVAGLGFICFGVWSISPNAGKIAVGIGLMVLGVIVELNGSPLNKVGKQ